MKHHQEIFKIKIQTGNCNVLEESIKDIEKELPAFFKKIEEKFG